MTATHGLLSGTRFKAGRSAADARRERWEARLKSSSRTGRRVASSGDSTSTRSSLSGGDCLTRWERALSGDPRHAFYEAPRKAPAEQPPLDKAVWVHRSTTEEYELEAAGDMSPMLCVRTARLEDMTVQTELKVGELALTLHQTPLAGGGFERMAVVGEVHHDGRTEVLRRRLTVDGSAGGPGPPLELSSSGSCTSVAAGLERAAAVWGTSSHELLRALSALPSSEAGEALSHCLAGVECVCGLARLR